MEEKTVQEEIDLGLETNRLNKRKIKFYIYDTAFSGKVGIVIKDKNIDNAMEKRITEAGYVYAGTYPKKKKCTLYTIDEEKLAKIHKNLNL